MGGDYHRALVLFDKYYDVLRLSVDAGTGAIWYRLRDVYSQRENEQRVNWKRLVRQTVRKYEKENAGTRLPLIDFVDCFENTHCQSFPSTRSLVRVLAKCGLTFDVVEAEAPNLVDTVYCVLDSRVKSKV